MEHHKEGSPCQCVACVMLRVAHTLRGADVPVDHAIEFTLTTLSVAYDVDIRTAEVKVEMPIGSLH